MAAAGPAAAAVVPYVHPISDAVVLKAHKEKHEGASDETWPPFVLQAENYAEEIDALYCLTRDPITRQNQINAMGYPAARVAIDQSRIFNFLVHAVAHYASVEISDVGRGTADAGSRLFDALCHRHQPSDAPARVSKKETLTMYCQTQFSHDNFDAFFDQIRLMRTMINNFAGADPTKRIDDEQLIATILIGVKSKDARYAQIANQLRMEPNPLNIMQLRARLKRQWVAITAEALVTGKIGKVNMLTVACAYPSCGGRDHAYADCPLKAQDLKLHREAQQYKRSKKQSGTDSKDSKKSSPSAKANRKCTYPKCMKDGHTIEHCWMKKRDERENAAGSEKSERKPKEKKEKTSRVAFAAAQETDAVENDFDMLCMKLSAVSAESGLPDAFLIDSGSSLHLTPDHDLLVNVRSCDKILHQVGDQKIRVTEYGDLPARVKMIDGDKISYPLVCFTEVYFVPTVDQTVISVPRAKACGFDAIFSSDHDNEGFRCSTGFIPFTLGSDGFSYLPAKVDHSKQAIDRVMLTVDASRESPAARGHPVRRDMVPALDSATAPSSSDDKVPESEDQLNESDDDSVPDLVDSDSDSDDDERADTPALEAQAPRLTREERLDKIAMYWHEATGHTNLTYLRSICTTVDGMEELQQLPTDYKLPPCSMCMLAKSRAQPAPKKAERSKLVHHLVHSDTTGKMRVRSARGNYYATVFVDDCSNFKIVKCHAKKSDYPAIYTERNVQAGRAPAVLRTDNAGEMTSAAFEAQLAAEGTFHQK